MDRLDHINDEGQLQQKDVKQQNIRMGETESALCPTAPVLCQAGQRAAGFVVCRPSTRVLSQGILYFEGFRPEWCISIIYHA